MKVRFNTSVTGTYHFPKGAEVDGTGNEDLTVWLKEQVRAGHAELISKAERAQPIEKVEKRRN